MEEMRKSLKGARRQLTLRIKALDESLSAHDTARTEACLSMLKDATGALQCLDRKVSVLCEESTASDSEAIADEECQKAFDYQLKANLCLQKAEQWLKEEKATTVKGTLAPNVKLQKLSLPTFEGDILEFHSFWETFDCRVNTNTSLNTIDKFDYLLSVCKGRAADALAAIPRTSAGYELAVSTLKRRFGRRAPIIDLSITELIELKHLSDECSVHDLRKMLDLVNVRIRSLISLGLDEKGGAHWIGPVLIARLPRRLRLRWEEGSRGRYGDDSGGLCHSLDEFLEFFHQMVEMEEAANTVDPKKNRPKESNPHRPSLSRKTTLSSSFNTHVSPSPSKCGLCRAPDHSIWKCSRFTGGSASDRKQVCRRLSLCFNCLSPNHSVSSCTSSFRCRRCDSKHHTLLHLEPQGPSGGTPSNPPDPPPPANYPAKLAASTSLSLPASDSGDRVLLQSCQAYAHSPTGGSMVVRVLFDSCSNYSFIRQSTAGLLKLTNQRVQPLTINTFGCKVIERDFPVATLELSSLMGGPRRSIDVIVAAELVHPIQGHQIDLSRFKHLQKLTIPEDHSSGSPLTVDIIIGANYYHDFVLYRKRTGSRNEPIAVKTFLGWTLHGPYSNLKHVQGEQSDVTTTLFCASMKSSGSAESTDLEKLWALEGMGVSPEPEQEWVKPKLDNANGRISTSLPWKSDQRPLSNLASVEPRQTNSDSRLNLSQQQQLNDYFQELEQLGIVEACSEIPPRNSWYLPHHCVWRKKLRVVFDGSFGHPSLNTMLMTGPNLITEIPICLTSYRLFPFPITADIEKAFLQIEIDQSDRDFLRFLHNGNSYRFCRVPFGLTCSPALLNSSLKLLYDSFQDQFPDTVQRLRHCTYVDDVVTSFPDEKSVLKFQTESTELFALAGMNLRGWASDNERVLGVSAGAQSEVLELALTDHPAFKSTSCTRREALSYTASLFDPLGLWLPWTIRLRMFLQTTWKAGLDWDDPFPPALEETWRQLLHEASHQLKFSCPRSLQFQENRSALHVFSDASQKAFATCAYILSSSGARLVYARGRVSPLKPSLTTPRAELMAALLSARAVKYLKENLPLLRPLRTYFWSDSTCVLSWLRGDPARLKPFVHNRVVEICEAEGEWKFVPSGENPADLASRGISSFALSSSSLWEQGPTWLPDHSSWPEQPSFAVLPEATMASSDSSPCTDQNSSFFTTLVQRTSTLTRFVRIVAWVLRFIRNSRRSLASSCEFLTHDEKETAFNRAIQQAQDQFVPEVLSVRGSAPVPRESPLLRLKPSWDPQRNLLVTTPRTNESPKIFLPQSARLTYLVILDIHVRSSHVGVDHTLAKFQAKYWTCRARLLVKRVVRDCRRCRRFRPRTYAYMEGQLPDFRAQFSPPFQNVGIDHAGPLHLRDGSKAYVLLFTCACVRAIHLELVNSLSTEDTALAFRRFQARRGIPLQVFSDNAACFKRLAPLVPAKWTFIPERSPTWGGWWERMIQCVKRSLRKVVGKTSLDWSSLFTVLLEIEGHINGRPLTYVSDEVDSVSPLTPAHFLSVPQPLGAPWISSGSVELNRSWRHMCKIASDLKNRWKSEYLPLLRQWRSGTSRGCTPAVGDVVLVSDGPRGGWPLGRIVALHPGRDCAVRVVSVKIRGKVTRRLVRMLFPLECS